MSKNVQFLFVLNLKAEGKTRSFFFKRDILKQIPTISQG